MNGFLISLAVILLFLLNLSQNGEQDAESIRKSMAYTLCGLGNKGLGDKEKAQADLEKAVELSVSNLWATLE